MKNILAIILILSGLQAHSQDDSLHVKKRKWYKPDHIKMQFAGNVGFISGGPGYISKNKTLETDFLLGFLPRKFGGDALVTTTLKTTYSPWRIHLKESKYIVPFSMGIWMSRTFGTQFDTSWPSYYPSGYYWWATAIRPGVYIGGKVGRETVLLKRKRGLEAYYELGTYDLKMVTYAQNTGTVRLSHIFSLALGVKMGF